MVPLTMVCRRLRAEAGGTPSLVTSRLMDASAARALFMDLRRLSLRVSAESNHTPSHLVASVAKGTSLPPTRTTRSLLARPWLLRFDSRMASVLVVSKRTALPSAYLKLSAHRSRPLATSSTLVPILVMFRYERKWG